MYGIRGVSGWWQAPGLSGVELWRCRVVMLLEGVGALGWDIFPLQTAGGRGSKDLTASGLQCHGRARAGLALQIGQDTA